jgi:hypothetical protein
MTGLIQGIPLRYTHECETQSTQNDQTWEN